MGSELEVRTKPVFNTSLGAGWTFTETNRTSDGTQALGNPKQTLKLVLRYDNSTLRGVLTGRHINWNAATEDNGKNALIWDLHLGATLYKREENSLELFFSGRNLFNSNFYQRDVFPSVGRWFESGMRMNF
jgi:vitamin B12 transporter